MRGKLIVIEGTDCSGKATQTNLLLERLKKEKIKAKKLHIPFYDTASGKIVAGPYLGKKHVSEGWFKEGADKVDPKVASLYYAADRRYNKWQIEELLESGYNVILDRYTTSNMGHQASKMPNKKDRMNLYKWVDTLEYKMLELPRPDKVIFLYMPYEHGISIRENRVEPLDQHEASEQHLKMAETAYLELANVYKWAKVDCVKAGKIKTREEIHEELFNIIKETIGNKNQYV